MSKIQTKNLGFIHNPHLFTPHMIYEHGLTPEERQSIREKLKEENINYKEQKKGREDLGCESALETQCYCMLARFNGYIQLHPNTINYKNGLIYTPDMKVLLPTDDDSPTRFYYVESHTVKNEDKEYRPVEPRDPNSTRAIPGDVLARLSCLCKEGGARILYMKPDGYFQIIAMKNGEPYEYPERQCALSYCTHCGNIFPDIFPYHNTCPFCNSGEIKMLLFGDGQTSGCFSIGGWRFKKGVDFFKEAGENAVTSPVRGEIVKQLKFHDTYGDDPTTLHMKS